MSSNMERRLILHEKLQGLKQKKMSIKQGDVLVTLNLRTDLANPSIEIAEKALFMLESFVDKNTGKATQDSGKLKPPPTASLCVDTISVSTSKSNFRSKDKLLISPSKRVRFVLDKSGTSESVEDLASSQETNLDISNSSGIVQDGIFFSVLSF